MRITFNNYKGFLLDEGYVDNVVDLKSFLTRLPVSIERDGSRKNAKKENKRDEYRTNGFDLLNCAWNSGELTNEDFDAGAEDHNSKRVQQYGQFLRNMCYEYSGQFTNFRNDDLSSHQTFYGDDVLYIQDDVIGEERANNGGNKLKKEKIKLSLAERKELRRKAKEMKGRVSDSRKHKKEEVVNKELELINGMNLTTTRSKINHLKFLVKECVEAAQCQTDQELTETSRIFQIDDVSLYISDLRNLLDDEWLSDSNIGWVYVFLYHGYIFPLLSVRLKNSKFYQYEDEKEVFHSPILMLLPTFTFLIANHPEPKELLDAKVIPPGISNAQFIFCPLNDNDDFGVSEGGSHWSLVVFVKVLSNGNSNRTFIQKALVFDSMFEANFSETNQLVNNMAKILHNVNDTKTSLNWDIVHVRDSPQQTNGSDCGVFVSSVTALLISELIALAQSPPTSATDFSLSKLRFSATDSRIWMLSSLLNCLKNHQ